MGGQSLFKIYHLTKLKSKLTYREEDGGHRFNILFTLIILIFNCNIWYFGANIQNLKDLIFLAHFLVNNGLDHAIILVYFTANSYQSHKMRMKIVDV